MPLQLIFTSASRGLTAGRSGYCTVARHRSISDRLVQILESIGTPHEKKSGATFTFRIIEASDKNWYVLSRFVAQGLDYSQRDNRLAHHLIFSNEEANVLPPPAAIALRWNGWLSDWTQEPTWLTEDPRPLLLENFPALRPASGWREFSGTGAKAAWLVNEAGPVTLCLTHPPEDKILLRLLAESAALLGRSAWYATFTTDALSTGADGFYWGVGHIAGRTEIDLQQATQQPAPQGDLARQAATGTQTAPPIRPTGETAAQKSSRITTPPLSRPWLWIGVMILGALGLLLFLILNIFSEKTPTANPANPTPLTTVGIQGEEIYRSNIAIKEVASLLDSENYMEAGKLWLESVKLSPTFAERYREQYLTRLKRNYAEKTSAQLLARLETRSVVADSKLTSEIAEDAAEAVRVGTELGLEKDVPWRKLLNIQARTQIIAELDIRPVILVNGTWVTTDQGQEAPSFAEFNFSAGSAEKILKFIESTGVSSEKTVSVNVRLIPLTQFHQRDNQSKYIQAEIRRGGQSFWIETNGSAGKAPITLGLGPRKKSCELNFPNGQATQLENNNRLLEIRLPDGSRQCIALISNWQKITPLSLGAWALSVEPDTGVVHAAAWAESALNAFQPDTGAVGLYPADHEFPDRNLASIRATRSLLETDLIRQERKFINSANGSEITRTRKKLFDEKDYIQAGLPWSLILVSPKGQAGNTLIDFK